MPREEREGEKEKPALTVYLLRHGESNEDKTDPNRGLTENGQAQVREAFARVLDQILAEEDPDFADWENTEAKKEALRQALQGVEFHLYDSGTYRTLQQECLEKDMLDALGLTDVYLTKAAYEWKGEQPSQAGPGIKKRLKGVGGLDKKPEFRKLIGDKNYQKKVGAPDELIAWALTPEDEVPAGVGTRKQMAERYKKDLAVVAKKAETLSDYPKRVVAVANSHASIITLAAADQFDMPIEEFGEVENAEGLRFDFYGNGKDYEVKPFGPDTESKLNQST